MADGSGYSLEHRNDDAFVSVSVGSIVDVIFVEHGRKRKQDAEEVGSDSASDILFGLNGRVMI